MQAIWGNIEALKNTWKINYNNLKFYLLLA